MSARVRTDYDFLPLKYKNLQLYRLLHFLLIFIAGMHLHRSRHTVRQKEIRESDGNNMSAGPSKTYNEYVQDREKSGSCSTMVELSTKEIQAERARIEEKSGVKGYDDGNSWAKLV